MVKMVFMVPAEIAGPSEFVKPGPPRQIRDGSLPFVFGTMIASLQESVMPQLLENPPPAPPRAAGRSHRWIWLGLLAIALGGGGGFWYWKAHRKTGGPSPAEESKTQVAVEAVQPQRGGLERNCVQPGSLERFEGADIYAKVSGFLAEQWVDIGSPVKRGQVLAKISVPEFDKLVQRRQGRRGARPGPGAPAPGPRDFCPGRGEGRRFDDHPE